MKPPSANPAKDSAIGAPTAIGSKVRPKPITMPMVVHHSGRRPAYPVATAPISEPAPNAV
jgi:hypothetical protein